MRLYIANGSHQIIDFQYRVNGFKNLRRQSIPIGGQQELSGDLNKEDVDSIIQQHLPYGMVRFDEIAKFRGYYTPYIFSIDKPVSAEIIGELVSQNRDFHNHLGVKIRKDAAVAVNNIIEEQIGTNLNSLEMTVEEMGTRTKDSEMNEGIRITRDKERGAPQGPQKSGF